MLPPTCSAPPLKGPAAADPPLGPGEGPPESNPSSEPSTPPRLSRTGSGTPPPSQDATQLPSSMKRIIAGMCSTSRGGSAVQYPAAAPTARGSGARAGLEDARNNLNQKLHDDGRVGTRKGAKKRARREPVVDLEWKRQQEAEKPKSDQEKVSKSCHVAEKADNQPRNRYFDVLPFDATRVRLQQGNDYINANMLRSRQTEVPSWQFIVTQGPLQNTVEHMWQMAWEQGCTTIVMLTRCVEDRASKCAPYFEEAAGSTCTAGRFMIQTTTVTDLDEHVRARELVLSTSDDPGIRRRICHYHYHAWPDHAAVELTGPLRRLAHLLDGQTSRPDSTGPPLIHCSAGIGRSGVLCTVAIALKRLRAADPRDGAACRHAVNVKRIVAQLRTQRRGMVQNAEQYQLCHQALLDELDDILGPPANSPLHSHAGRRQSSRLAAKQ